VIGADSRAGDDTDGAQQRVRQCAVSRAHKPPEELIRFVAAPDGTIVPDLARRLPGRGVWIDATAAAVANAVRQRAFARSLKRPVVVSADLPQQIEQLLVRRLAGALGMANKAGLIVTGFVKVERQLREGRVFVLVHAAEASAAEAARLDRLFKVLPGPGGAEAEPADRIVHELTSAELSLAMGRPTVVHAAAAAGGASQRLLAEARRLRRYRSGDAAAAPRGRPNVAAQGTGLARDPGRDIRLRCADANPKPGQGSGASSATIPGGIRPEEVPVEVPRARGTDSTGTDSTGTDSTGTDIGHKSQGHKDIRESHKGRGRHKDEQQR
jgi:predicted RNA-binding protein YlxR (DUF448 family)